MIIAISLHLYIAVTPSVAWAERTKIIINLGNEHEFSNDEKIFDYDYAKQMCGVFFDDRDAFYLEANKYRKTAESIYRIALISGEEKARPYYLDYKKEYERYYDLMMIEDYALGLGSCRSLEDIGLFGKQ